MIIVAIMKMGDYPLGKKDGSLSLTFFIYLVLVVILNNVLAIAKYSILHQDKASEGWSTDVLGSYVLEYLGYMGCLASVIVELWSYTIQPIMIIQLRWPYGL